MDDWASRRKNIYLGAIALFLSALSFFIFWKFWYKAPTCFDGYRNGDETGIDCGGSCTLVCKASILQPIIRWDPRLFEVSKGIWNALVYVENPNIDAKASYLPYTLTLYGEDNKVLAVKEGATILPKNKTVGIFEGGIFIPEGKKPKRGIFELGGKIRWERSVNPEPNITVTHSPLSRLETTPRVEANIKNNDVWDIHNIELVVAIFDGADNAVATSRTFVEELKANKDASVFFTWPKPFELGIKTCEKPSSVVLAIDRSGSMQSLGQNPPEPLTSVKNAASFFAGELKSGDSIGIVTFATDASVDLMLQTDFKKVQSTLNGISIQKGSTQFTNIAGAFLRSYEILSQLGPHDSQKVVILLTDGVATRPADPKGKNEVDDMVYAEAEALKIADSMKNEGAIIYAIGLGKDIHQNFLNQIASSPKNFLLAPSTSTLSNIYEQISTSICKELPSRIEITYKIFGRN